MVARPPRASCVCWNTTILLYRRQARRGRGQEPHSGQAHGHDDVASQRNGDHLSLPHPTFSIIFARLISSWAQWVGPSLSEADWIKDGAVVVDAGYHPGGVGDIELGPLLARAQRLYPGARRRRTHDHQHADSTNRTVRRKSDCQWALTSAWVCESAPGHPQQRHTDMTLTPAVLSFQRQQARELRSLPQRRRQVVPSEPSSSTMPAVTNSSLI